MYQAWKMAFLGLGWPALGATFVVSLAYADPLSVAWSTIDGGGTVEMVAGGDFVLSGTIGQPDAGRPMVGGSYQITGGFWAGGRPVASDVVEADPPGSTPGEGALVLRLRGGAPNPFHTRARVSFETPSAGAVHLAILDPSGRLCRTLLDARLAAGRHERVWDGRDDLGRTVASGIYFAVLRTPLGQHREKLVKIR